VRPDWYPWALASAGAGVVASLGVLWMALQ